MPILFCADTHGEWAPLIASAIRHDPEHIVLLGDLDLDRPLLEKLGVLVDGSRKIWWIHGNHDCDDVERWANLFPHHPDGNLSGRSVTMECRDGAMTVAGLGGIFKGRVWLPKNGDEAPNYELPEEFMASGAPEQGFRGGLPMFHRDTIFPSHVAALKNMQAEILVCHEAPTSIPRQKGFGAIDNLAAAMGVKMVLHGHHHFDYMGMTRDGIAVRGLSRGYPIFMSPQSFPVTPATEKH